MRTILEIYTSTEGMSIQVKEALLEMISMDGRTDGAKGKVSMRECLGILAQLDSLLCQTRIDPSRAALLSAFLSREEPQQ